MLKQKIKIDKLDFAYRQNPLYSSDGYKVGHPYMIVDGANREYMTWIPRSLKYIHKSILKVTSAGQQMVVRYLHSEFQENFFAQPISVAERFAKDMCKYLGQEYVGEHFMNLHTLGYLPIKIQSLPEGIETPANIPHLTVINTVDGFAWLGLYLETMISKCAWQIATAATLSRKFKQNAIDWVLKTDKNRMFLTDFMTHDFHSRGGNPFTSFAIGLAHAMFNLGSDTLDTIPAARYFYDAEEDEVVINSVNASEHSVTCTGIFFYEKELRKIRADEKYLSKLKEGKLNNEIVEYYSFDAPCEGSIEDPDYLAIAEWLNLRRWLTKFPNGILSVVSDTFDLWKLITFILPRLKTEILARNGKLVIRPDSGNPVDILCGNKTGKFNEKNFQEYKFESEVTYRNMYESKGVIELLWEIFGGTVNEQGYKVFDSHIGAIYGDSINLDRQVEIYSRMADKRFAVTNVVLGIGSYTYVYITRDTLGFAAKGAWFSVYETNENGEREEVGYDIFKDPITDDGTKKSLKGFQFVSKNEEGVITTQPSTEAVAYSNANMLQTIYEDGYFLNQVTLSDIRKRTGMFYS